MARRTPAPPPAPRPQFDATEAAGPDIKWFWPADWDMADDDPEAAAATGWHYRGRLPGEGFDRWFGPYLTSTAAQEAKPR